MTHLSLIFPLPSPDYHDVIWSAKDAPSAPQTAPAELGAYVKAYSSSPVQVQAINPQTVENDKVRYLSVDEIVTLCQDSDVVGVTCLYHNQETAQSIAEALKKQDPNKKIIFGGQNVSNKFMANLILTQIPAVDYVVLGEGEEALLGLVNNISSNQIPNLAYRENGKVKYTPRNPVNLDKIPLWDYEDTLNAKLILEAHDSRTALYQESVERYRGRTLGEIGVFSQRGCPKSAGVVGNHKGNCRFCTSAESSHSQINPENFWKQLESLNQKYGIQDFFIADNIFGISLKQLKEFETARRKFDLPKSIQFRAYTYPSILNNEEGKEIVNTLRKIGIINIFLGVETFVPEISLLSNKDPVTYETVERAIKMLGDAGIDTFVPLMPGLPRESKESIKTNLDCLEKLLSRYSSKEYGKGNLVRVDISPAMSLVGSAWHAQLVHDERVRKDYFDETGKTLETDMTPNFDLLRGLSLRHYSSATAEEVKFFETQAKKMVIEYMKPEMVGGFDLKRRDVEEIQKLSKG